MSFCRDFIQLQFIFIGQADESTETTWWEMLQTDTTVTFTKWKELEFTSSYIMVCLLIVNYLLKLVLKI